MSARSDSTGGPEKTSEDKHQSLRRVHQVEPEEVNSGSTMITGSNQLLMHVPPYEPQQQQTKNSSCIFLFDLIKDHFS